MMKLAITLLFGLALLPVSARAIDLSPQPGETVVFQFLYENQDVSWAYSTGDIDTSQRSIEVGFLEYPVPWFSAGLHGGYLSISQFNNPATEGMDLSGSLIGFMLNADIGLSWGLGLQLSADYSDYRVRDEISRGRSILTWNQLSTEASLYKKFTFGRIGVGFNTTTVNGDEKTTVTQSATRAFTEAESQTRFMEWSLLTDATGTVSLRSFDGAKSGIHLRFARYY